MVREQKQAPGDGPYHVRMYIYINIYIYPLLAGELVVKAAQANGKGLEGAQGVAVVHRKRVVGALAKLEDDAVLIRVLDQLKVLDGGDGHPALKVEAEGAEVLVPPRGLVDDFDVVVVFLLNLGRHALLRVRRLKLVPNASARRLREEDLHLSGPVGAEHVAVILHDPHLGAHIPPLLVVAGVVAAVVNGELCPHEVALDLSRVGRALAGEVLLIA
mmetsp:Transcript_33976/g.79553  ORF Transcript_33976/g.79553 Transcript_33976/m.79553 type:complete len:216 (-) Transcript_33976:859-1506(-)